MYVSHNKKEMRKNKGDRYKIRNYNSSEQRDDGVLATAHKEETDLSTVGKGPGLYML